MFQDENNHKKYFADIKTVFSLEYKDSPGTCNPDFHVHKQYEILYCMSNNMFCETDKSREKVNADTLMLFSSVDLHQFGTQVPGSDNRRYVLYFDPNYMDNFSSNSVNLLDCFLFRPFELGHILPLKPDEAVKVKALLDRILEMQDKSDEECYGKELRLQLLLAELLLEINDIYRHYHNISSTGYAGNYRFVYEIINYIHENYADELSLDSISQRFYINKYSLCEIFKKVSGTTPNQYIINCRVQKAKELLLNGASVERACAESGFNNLSHFSRIFKSKVGQSPKQYQKNQRNKPIRRE